MSLPAPILTEHHGFVVVRDDLLPGGTKRRAIHVFFDNQHNEYIYAAPAQGHAQLALALAAQDAGKRAVIFCAQRHQFHSLTQRAIDAGARVEQVSNGFLTVVQARAREYCKMAPGRYCLPFGLDDERFIEALTNVAISLPVSPTEVWSITSSGVLSRALQRAWPDATFFGVRVGAEPNAGKATVFTAPESFARPAQIPPPYPSSPNFDAKLWRFVREHASSGALIWNVA